MPVARAGERLNLAVLPKLNLDVLHVSPMACCRPLQRPTARMLWLMPTSTRKLVRTLSARRSR